MPLLRVVLKATPTYAFMLWTTWPARVEAWRASFTGTAYKNVGSPLIENWRAVAYLECPANVTESQLDSLRRHWSMRVAGVAVDGPPVILPTQQAVETDRAFLRSQTPSGQLGDTLAKVIGDTGRAVLLGAVVVAVAYGVARSQGEKTWR